jgi:3-hydroxy acid dehydrogenase/malonic semialdehyde reductase
MATQGKLRVDGKIVFITGAASGFGAACARRYAREGARLILLDRLTEPLAALQEELAVPVHALAVDVRDRATLIAEVDALPTPFADVDILINNAGLARGLAKAHTADLDDWDVMVDTNIKGVLYTTRAILPGMVDRRRGHIVNLGSVAGSYPYLGGNVYGASKAFVNLFSPELRADLLGKGVRVTSIEPGLSETSFSASRFGGHNESAAAIYKGANPLTAEDIADSIYWVTSLPDHYTINRIEMMPISQSFAPLTILRK